MDQLSFLHKQVSTPWHLYIDGAARGNPGLAGAGIYLADKKNPVVQASIFIGTKTNNQAEYLALLFGLLFVKTVMQSGDSLTIFSDSQLLVRQIAQEYKVKHPSLKLLYQEACILLPAQYRICHIPREQNTQADSLANRAVDNKCSVPVQFLTQWSLYERLLQPS